jgi:hypothetical protein
MPLYLAAPHRLEGKRLDDFHGGERRRGARIGGQEGVQE